MTIDRGSDRPAYRQLADLIREALASGRELQLTEGSLAATYGLGRDTVRRALYLLRTEGLIVTDNTGSRPRTLGEMTDVPVPAGSIITARMPTEPERREHGIGEGVPVLVVDGTIYPADRYRLSS